MSVVHSPIRDSPHRSVHSSIPGIPLTSHADIKALTAAGCLRTIAWRTGDTLTQLLDDQFRLRLIPSVGPPGVMRTREESGAAAVSEVGMALEFGLCGGGLGGTMSCGHTAMRP